jgi:hypothetical protein
VAGSMKPAGRLEFVLRILPITALGFAFEALAIFVLFQIPTVFLKSKRASEQAQTRGALMECGSEDARRKSPPVVRSCRLVEFSDQHQAHRGQDYADWCGNQAEFNQTVVCVMPRVAGHPRRHDSVLYVSDWRD